MIRNASKNVIGISEKNPHYFQYKGKEVLLLTAAEHYGAVICKTFDYIKYFDALHAYGLNYTRIYPGAFVECAGKWMDADSMAPGPDLITPWARSDVPGYHGGGNKFDLSKWDAEYFARLDDFLIQAEKRDIIVEICFFNCQYPDFVEYSPLHKDANIQGIGTGDHVAHQTLDDKELVAEQLKYIEKIIQETNKFDNVIYEFVDEPTLYLTPSNKVTEWVNVLIDKAIETEDKLPKKHLLAQQQELGVNFAEDDRIGLIVTQYIQCSARQVGGMDGLHNLYAFNKPIEMNETAYINSWFKEDSTDVVGITRLEAWEFMLAGGAAVNQLNGYFNPANPGGESPVNAQVLQGLKNLRTFMEGFDYVNMYRIRPIRDVTIGARVSAIAELGKQYAIYMHHSFPGYKTWGMSYDPCYGVYEPVITIGLDKGSYAVTFVEPATLKVIAETTVESDGGDVKIACPKYNLDIAIKIVLQE